MDASPAHWLVDRIAEHGEKVFLHAPAGSITYRELGSAVQAMHRRVQQENIAPGEVLLVVGDYSANSIALLLALIASRAIVVPLTAMPEAELRRRAAIAQASRVVRDVPGGPQFERLAPTTGADHALLRELRGAGHAGLVLFSSGSTGEPKAMVHDLDRLLDSYRTRKARALTLLVFLMFDHIGGLNTLFTSLASGATMVIPATREPDHVCELIARHRVAVLPTSPTFLNLMLLSGAWKRHDLGALRIITYGTEPMPEALLQRLRAALPHVKFLQTFGTSETGIARTTSKSSDSTLLKLDDPDLETRIVEGELWLRSRTQILGYLNHSRDAFTADGWFKTGDLVEPAADGFLRVVGRRTELINVGGEKVLPGEVEAVLLAMPEVADCIVRGEPSPITGQVVAAEVVLRPGVDAGEMRKRVRVFCRERLAGYKIPVKVDVVPETQVSARFKKVRLAPSPAR